MEQGDLLRLLRRDPEAGMSQILDQYGKLMYAIALNILKSPQDAEDCISEALVRLWKNHRQIKSETGFRNYLCSVTRNIAIDFLRTRQKRMEDALVEELAQKLPIADTTAKRLDSLVIR